MCSASPRILATLTRLSLAETGSWSGTLGVKYVNLGRSENSCGLVAAAVGKSNVGIAKLLNDMMAQQGAEE